MESGKSVIRQWGFSASGKVEKNNTDIIRMWLALALALKDLYRLRDSTLQKIFEKISSLPTMGKTF